MTLSLIPLLLLPTMGQVAASDRYELSAEAVSGAVGSGAVVGTPTSSPSKQRWTVSRQGDQLEWRLNRQNGESSQSITLHQDATGPAIEWQWRGAVRSQGGSLVIGSASYPEFEVEDPAGVAAVRFGLNGAAPELRRLPRPLPDDSYSVAIEAEDRLGNMSQKTIEFRLDTGGPEIAIELLTAIEGAAGFSMHPAQVQISVEDQYGPGQLLQPEAASSDGKLILTDTSVTAVAEDALGNESTSTLSWHYDRTVPTASLSYKGYDYSPNGTIKLRRNDVVSFVVDDAETGVAEANYQFNGGKPRRLPDTLRFVDRGRYEVQVSVVDKAGNQKRLNWLVLAR